MQSTVPVGRIDVAPRLSDQDSKYSSQESPNNRRRDDIFPGTSLYFLAFPLCLESRWWSRQGAHIASEPTSARASPHESLHTCICSWTLGRYRGKTTSSPIFPDFLGILGILVIVEFYSHDYLLPWPHVFFSDDVLQGNRFIRSAELFEESSILLLLRRLEASEW